ncbi:hypothetical protein LSH36_561g03030 [Paralvinella palmiformis]|uniref:Uncharacterized protein n=1 Tax=Paralvinella palmiformis TaxID=53620 RepID=A0AAD9J6X1_9ANNE|nr:hypothetical protein LSH36_561g03030 [Paralvinella palmiformis]
MARERRHVLPQEEKKSPASKGRRRFRIKRTRKDNYVSIEDEREESVALLDDAGNDWKAVPYMASLSLEDQILSDQEATWNVHPNRQIGDGIWRPDATDSFNRSVECLHQAAGKNKRKRSLKIRSKKNNKKTAPKHYQQLRSSVDHLEDVTSANKKRTSRRTKQVKRRLWRICKSGWKTMKSGLVHYSKGPVIRAKFNPVLRRYEDGFKEFEEMDVS